VTQPHLWPVSADFALIALGSNATSRHGDPRATVKKAARALGEGPLRRVALSALYLTPFVPAGAGADVVNAVAIVETDLAPEDLLAHLHAIEAEFDRARGARWSDRTLDLDLLAHGERVLPDGETQARWAGMAFDEQRRVAPDQLILPHPRLQDRAFVLVPLAELAGDWRHPVTGARAREMLAALPADEVAAVRRLD